MSRPFPSLVDELPIRTIPDEPHWSENYCYEGYDVARDIGFWLHLGRWPRDARIWREQLWIYLPDGRYTIIRGFGSHPVEQGAGGALLRITCSQPGEWRIQFRGPTRLTSPRRMAQDCDTYLSDGPFAFIDVDLQYSARHPAWNFGDVLQEENWSRYHYEQHGAVRGTIKLQMPGEAWQTFEMDGDGYRDHSRGPRELSTFGGNYWIHGQFPSGRAFAMMHVWKLEGGKRVPAFSQGVMIQDGVIHPATFDGVPLLTDKRSPSQRYQLRMQSKLGTMVLDAEIRRSFCQSADSFMDSFDGVTEQGHGVLYVWEEATEFVWNGERGIGHTERAERP